MLRINNISMTLNANEQQLKQKAAQKLGVNETELQDFTVSKKSVDARNKNNVHFVYSVDCNSVSTVRDKDIEQLPEVEKLTFNIKNDGVRPIVVGSGPAGMFAGLALAEAGLNPIILERGAPVEQRQKDVAAFWHGGELKINSNVQFGEGGAGTFSDGKLMTGIKKDKFTAKVLQEFAAAGAPKEILYLAKPHIGTDKLRLVVKNIRQKILSLGGEYRFNSQLTGLVIKNDKLVAVKVTDEKATYELPANKLFLAIGHSARDTFEMLYDSGVHMEQKPFSVGARIEHKQTLINKAQYGKAAESPYLGAADYKMAVHLPNGRSVYTFCMCPGGVVVAAASEKGRVVTNGMSEFARAAENANSALLVGVSEKDFGSNNPLAGMYFQRKLEENAFIAGDSSYRAPAVLVGDFLRRKVSQKLGDVRPTYFPGVALGGFKQVLPSEIADSLRLGIVEMAKKLHGFDCYDAVLTGVETRSSSPVRIVRDETMQSNIKGLYPCGEGAGYAGGITSAAADGLKAVYALQQDK